MTTFTRLTDQISDIQLKRSDLVQYGLIAGWILAMIALPIIKWVFGEQIIPAAVTFALLIQFCAVITIVQNGLGWRATWMTFGIVAVTTWFMEFMGSSTGFPFGEYDYTNLLQPQIGHVPLLIPLAWFMMLPSAWSVAGLIAGRENKLAYIGVSAIAITAWDLFLDPQMVDWGFWVWENPVGYFGIPWVNYGGWLLTGALVTLIVRPYRFDLPILPLLVIYAVVWFLQSVGQAIFWGQVGPAIVGSIVMGALLLISIRKYLKSTLS